MSKSVFTKLRRQLVPIFRRPQSSKIVLHSRIPILLALLTLLVVKLLNPTAPTTSETNPPNWQDVPEMTDILGDNQETRLLAARRLVERVGVATAMEVLEHSPLPHTGEGHLAVHQIGFYAYQKYGQEGILHCKDYFLFACYHGVLIEAATDQGLDGVKAMAQTCKGSSARFFQCAHAVGHALLAMWNYDLPEALTDCDEIFASETQFPESLSSCHNGAFMENLFGVHDWGTTTEPVRDWLKDDEPYFPCTAFEEKYQKGCWLNQAARIYQLEDGDIVKTKETCEAIENPQYTIWCMDNLARQIHPLTAGNIDQVFSLCQQVGPYWYENCIVVNAGSYYSVGDPNSAITICNHPLSPEAQADCYQNVIGQLVPDPNPTAETKRSLCQQIARTEFAQMCLSQIQSLTPSPSSVSPN
ncbi:MAG: hypothetical protein HYS86_02750 [Candidatus Chisholmbacteria bacterium]|nr:hypothetical protein [Candidatus Chisholmbacteria bacterium]